MRDYVKMRQAEDREEFLNNRVKSMKPIFKNFVDNNTNILRREVGKEKVRTFKENEEKEEEIYRTLMDQTQKIETIDD